MGRGTFQGCLPPFPRGGHPQDLTGFWILLCSGEAFIPSSRNHFSQCQALLNKITSVNPQTEIDGLRNIWIIKPAAKSRGRGESQPGARGDSRPAVRLSQAPAWTASLRAGAGLPAGAGLTGPR